MASLIEQLPADIARLEAKFGSENRFVKQLKEQLRASKANQGKTAQDVYRLQAMPVGQPLDQSPGTPQNSRPTRGKRKK